ncbi:MAG: glycosyltransferase [Blautia wexlerae]
MEISFIIPAYNGEQFIMRNCICEIRRWEWEEQIEILIIDDGLRTARDNL